MTTATVSGSVQRVASPSRETFERDYVETGTPVILTDMVTRWPAYARWPDMDYLKDRVGRRKVPVLVEELLEPRRERDGFLLGVGPGKAERELVPMQMDAFIDLVSAGDYPPGKYYISDVNVQKHLPELLEDIQDPHVLEGFSGGEYNGHYRVIFFGRDNFTQAHMHFRDHTLVAQVIGEKHVKLYPPEQYGDMYPWPLWARKRSPFASQVHIDNPDYDRFPRFRNTKPLEAVVRAGEILYIPTYWWHAVYSPGLNLAIPMTYNIPKGWIKRYPYIGMRCALATNLQDLALKLNWREE